MNEASQYDLKDLDPNWISETKNQTGLSECWMFTTWKTSIWVTEALKTEGFFIRFTLIKDTDSQHSYFHRFLVTIVIASEKSYFLTLFVKLRICT